MSDRGMDFKAQRDKAVETAVQVILGELNGGNRSEIAAVIVQTVQRDHRTLQQAFWSAMLLAQIKYAESGHDLRNQDSVELAKAVKALAIEKNLDGGLGYV